MSEILTVLGESSAEYEEKHSRFIANLKHCDTEEEAIKFIEEMRSKYWDARHNCFAYSVLNGKISRFSDDGEPHGTAGKPILDVINGNGLTNTIIVVTRYFGGTLLGTGGLVRAYSLSSKSAVERACIAQMVNCTIFETVCEYTEHSRLVSLIESNDGTVESTDFTDKVRVKYVFKDSRVDKFIWGLNETFSARLKAEILENKIFAIKI